MFAIDWKTSWPLVETAIRDHNKAHVVGRRKDGRAIYDLKKVLRASHQHLLKEMIRLYSHQLTGLEWLHLTTELPPFRTHCGELASELDVSKGTINNLLNRLLESGLVAERDHRGRCNKFALRFDPSILVIHPELHRRRQMALNGILDNDTGYQAPWEEEGETLQQSLEAGSFKKENKLSDGTGDKKEKAPTPKQDEASNPALGGKTRASNARLREGGKISPMVEKTAKDTEMEVLEASNPPFQDQEKFSSKREKTANKAESKAVVASNPALGGKSDASDARLQDGQMQPKKHRGARRTAREIGGKTPIEKQGNWGYFDETPQKAPISGQFADHCARLLTVMVGTLWSRLDYLATSQLDAMKAFLHGQFVCKTAAEGEETYRNLWLRIGLADKWAKKKPRRYIPIPSTYLAPGNLNGFDRTSQWLENMRMTSKRAEKARDRYQYLAKSIGAVLHSTGKHLEENGLHSYVKRRKEVTDKYAHLGTAFDWVVLDPRANQSGGD